MEKFETVTLDSDLIATEELEGKGLCPIPEEAEEDQSAEKGMKSLLQKIGGWGEKLHCKPFPWKSIFNPRNALIAGCVALIAVAGYLNVKFSSPAIDVPSAPTEIQKPSVDADSNQEADSLSDFFAQAVISRERVRDEAIDVLRELTEDETADAVSRQDAFEQMNLLAEQISSEVNIENLVRSKGFAQCVAVVSEENVNVIVQSEGLTPGEVAQIKEIVYLQTGVLPKSIKIIEKSAETALIPAASTAAPIAQ